MFTVLIAGMCAVMIEHSPQVGLPPMAGIGYVKGDKCDLILMLKDDGPTPPLALRLGEEKHRYMLKVGKTEALVFVDDKSFTVPRGQPL